MGVPIGLELQLRRQRLSALCRRLSKCFEEDYGEMVDGKDPFELKRIQYKGRVNVLNISSL
jgi:hypothetical protein